MQGAILFTNDGAVHPVRRGFPAAEAIAVAPARTLADDLRYFLACYAAGFVAVYALIA